DLRFHLLEFGIGEETLFTHVLGALEPRHRRIVTPARAGRDRRGCGRTKRAELNPARSRPHFLELADAALLAPGLRPGLANAVDLLCFLLSEAFDDQAMRRALVRR